MSVLFGLLWWYAFVPLWVVLCDCALGVFVIRYRYRLSFLFIDCFAVCGGGWVALCLLYFVIGGIYAAGGSIMTFYDFMNVVRFSGVLVFYVTFLIFVVCCVGCEFAGLICGLLLLQVVYARRNNCWFCVDFGVYDSLCTVILVTLFCVVRVCALWMWTQVFVAFCLM